MATTSGGTGAAETTGISERSLDRASWGALFAGFFVGVGTLFLLLSLGAAIGFSAVNPRELGSWRNIGVGVGVWGGIAAIIAAFFSAWVAARLCTATDRSGGIMHGVTLWGLTWAVMLWVGAMAIGGAVTTTVSAAGGAANAAGGALSGLSASAVTDEAVQQANAWLREQGKPEVPPAQMQAALQDVASDAMARVRAGESPAAALREDALVASLSQNTNLSRADSQELAAQVRQQMQGALSGAGEGAPAVADAAASGASKGAWGAFAAALFTLLASAAGGAAGIPDRVRRQAAAARVPATSLSPAPQHS